jgi:hypothetical protein
MKWKNFFKLAFIVFVHLVLNFIIVLAIQWSFFLFYYLSPPPINGVKSIWEIILEFLKSGGDIIIYLLFIIYSLIEIFKKDEK